MRLRIFAGPNGSGKSTLFPKLLKEKHFSDLVYINPDTIVKDLGLGKTLTFPGMDDSGFLDDLAGHPLVLNQTVTKEAVEAVIGSPSKGISLAPGDWFEGYLSVVLVEALRHHLIRNEVSYAFESVFSHPDKLEEIREAKKAGYRIYLYYICTDDVLANVSRVEERVARGGHDVAPGKIMERYDKSLALLPEVIALCDRAFLYDNSNEKPELMVEFEGDEARAFFGELPLWLVKAGVIG